MMPRVRCLKNPPKRSNGRRYPDDSTNSSRIRDAQRGTGPVNPARSPRKYHTTFGHFAERCVQGFNVAHDRCQQNPALAGSNTNNRVAPRDRDAKIRCNDRRANCKHRLSLPEASPRGLPSDPGIGLHPLRHGLFENPAQPARPRFDLDARLGGAIETPDALERNTHKRRQQRSARRTIATRPRQGGEKSPHHVRASRVRSGLVKPRHHFL